MRNKPLLECVLRLHHVCQKAGTRQACMRRRTTRNKSQTLDEQEKKNIHEKQTVFVNKSDTSHPVSSYTPAHADSFRPHYQAEHARVLVRHPGHAANQNNRASRLKVGACSQNKNARTIWDGSGREKIIHLIHSAKKAAAAAGGNESVGAGREDRKGGWSCLQVSGLFFATKLVVFFTGEQLHFLACFFTRIVPSV